MVGLRWGFVFLGSAVSFITQEMSMESKRSGRHLMVWHEAAEQYQHGAREEDQRLYHMSQIRDRAVRMWDRSFLHARARMAWKEVARQPSPAGAKPLPA